MLCYDVSTIMFKYMNFKTKHQFKKTNKNYNKNEINDLYTIKRIYLYRINDKILINYTNVVAIDASNNDKIKNLNNFKKLKELDVQGDDCGIDDNGIKNLNLKKLNAYNNQKITDVNHMTNLEDLNTGLYSGIDDNGIKKINLKNYDG